MDKEDVRFDVIKESLKKIIKYFVWIGTIDLFLLIGLFQKHDQIIIGQYSFPLRYITIFVMLALLYFTISITHKLHRILVLYKTSENQDAKDNIKTFLNLYPSLLNPFAQHDEMEMSPFFDNLGLGLQTFLYSFGYLLSLHYISQTNKIILFVVFIVFILLTLFHFDLGILLKNTYGILSKKNEKMKRNFSLFFLVLVIIIVIILSYST